MMVDLKKAPFCLSDADCRRVEELIDQMSDEERVGQIFFGLSASYDPAELTRMVERYHLGGCRYNTAASHTVRAHNLALQRASKIPLFIAVNTESGGDNACSDGESIGSGVKIGATGCADYARALGRLANEEAAALGCNMAFAPVCDISYNWQNTEVISRAFGRDAEQVARMSRAYLDGAHELQSFACAAKHFPGNGTDFRDAHLSNNINPLFPRNWDETYGKVYRNLIDGGLEAVMAGHIMLPAYARAINPKLSVEEEMLPATLSPEIITGLLRERLGFNGLVITDATHMVGMTCRMKRAEMLVRSVNAGCDMLLFFNDPDEDFATVLEAYRSGTISEERLRDALRRILGLKMHMGLIGKSAEQLVPPEDAAATAARRQLCRRLQREISERGITLVKYRDAEVLPVTPQRYKRIMLVHVRGAESGMTALMRAVGMAGGSPVEALRKKLEARGFEVFVYENPVEQMLHKIQAGEKVDVNEFFAGKSAIADFTARMDLVLTVCDVASGRPCFGLSKGGGEIPWYVFEVPTIVLGVQSPTMLADIPQARTYINTYDAKSETLDVLLDKLAEGAQAFTGSDPIDSFCGLPDAQL
ncbi:MAG: glycoside hydrolase family 3 protein [Candidatus Faecivicinus sp.]